MRILFIGDVFASGGRRMVAENLQKIISEEKIDLAIVNGENSAGGFGITPMVAQELFSYGVDVITSGNHIWDKKEIFEFLPREPRLLRPANYNAALPGAGLHIARARSGRMCAVMSLQGRTHMPATECPFRTMDALLASIDPEVKVRFVDFHAEMTSEKMAMGWYLDGRVSAMIGTHTHIPTADARILPQGAAYLTDAGMTGPYASVIGVEKDTIIKRFMTALPIRMEAAKGGLELHGVIIEADDQTGRAVSVKSYAIIDSAN